MKYLKQFANQSDYQTFKESEDYITPNVSYIVEGEFVSFEPYVPDMSNYLTIEALEDGLTVSLSFNGCEYCVDGDGNWKELVAETATKSINTGHTLSFRGNLTPAYWDGIGTFTISKKCNLKGNCMSILFGDDAANNYSLGGYAFYNLFYNCTNIVNVSKNFLPATTLAISCYNSMFSGCANLTTAPELPATTLKDHCYSGMFGGCTSLTTAPELPATTLASYCYDGMFYGCTSLTTAPVLPATTLADSCYDYMFSGCTNLTAAPELPATTLANNCYSVMFQNCTNLITAPELPATTLVDHCYNYMFDGCTKLNYIKMLATNISASNCLYNWVKGVASSGTFVKNSAMTTLPTGTSGIPSGWTVENDGEVPVEPEVPVDITIGSAIKGDGKAYIKVPYYCNVYDDITVCCTCDIVPGIVLGALDNTMPVTLLQYQDGKAYARWGNPSATMVTFSKTYKGGSGIGMDKWSLTRSYVGQAQTNGRHTVYDFGKEPTEVSCTVPLHIFACNKSNSTEIDTRIYTGTISYLKINDARTNELKLDLVPAKKSNGEIGMYDNISKQFYGNSNTTGTFTFIA